MKKLSTSKLKHEKQGKFQELNGYDKMIASIKNRKESVSGKFVDFFINESEN